MDLLLLDNGSPTQTTILNIPPPIDPFSELGNNVDTGLFSSGDALDILTGSDAGLNRLVLDDLVLSNLLGKRRSDSGSDDFLYQLLGQGSSAMESRAPSSVAAPVQPPRRRRKKGGSKNNKRQRKNSRSGGGGSLCEILGICDSHPSATQEQPIKSYDSPQLDVPFASSQVQPLIIEAPENKRLGEKTAAEIAAIYSRTDKDDRKAHNPRRSEMQMEDSQYAASSRSNTLSIAEEQNPQPRLMDDEPKEIDFSEGQQINLRPSRRKHLRLEQNGQPQSDGPQEEYRMSLFGQNVHQMNRYSNLPIASINFDLEEYEERRSKMISDTAIDDDPKEIKKEKEDEAPEAAGSKKDFHIENHNVDREAKTWRPMRMNNAGEMERTDVSETNDSSDWIPKVGLYTRVKY